MGLVQFLKAVFIKRTATTDHPLLPVWQEQLAALKQRKLRGSENPWLDHVRAKVLRYLISRYGHHWVAPKALDHDSLSGLSETFPVSSEPLGLSRIAKGKAARLSNNRVRELLWDIHHTLHPTSRRNNV